MKKLLAKSVAFAALIASPAMPVEAAAQAYKGTPTPIFSWTGVYLGGNFGATFLQNDWSNVDPPGLNTSDANIRRSGFAGGGQIGINYQHAGLVLGAEADRSWAGLHETQVGCYATTFRTLQPLTCSTSGQWFAAVAVRLGVAWQRFLLYGKVGEAWGHFNYDNGCTLCLSTNYSASETRAGRIAGGGIEYAIIDSFTAKIEYDYLDFGMTTRTFVGNVGGMFNQDLSNRVHVLKVGLNYLFGWPG